MPQAQAAVTRPPRPPRGPARPRSQAAPNAEPLSGGPESGFALLEVLVGFIITVLAVAVMVGVTVETLRGSKAASRYQEATVRAQSRLAETVRLGPLLPGDREGNDGGGYQWHVHVTPLLSSTARAAEAQPGDRRAVLQLYGVTVWISWQDGAATRNVRLDTQALGPPAPG